MVHVGNRWETLGGAHIFPPSSFQCMQVFLRGAGEVVSDSVMWWHGMKAVSGDGEQAVIQLGEDLHFFDVVVWGKEPTRFLTLLEQIISSLLRS